MRGCTAAATLSLGALLLLGGATRGCDDPAAPEAKAPPRGPEDSPGDSPEALIDAPAAPAPSQAETLRFAPAEPRAGEPVTVTGGPISFRDGCQGIASVTVRREGRRIEVRWTPKQVPPDAMCTMAMHDEPVVATVEGLEAGTYEVVILPSGGSGTLVVAPAEPGAGGKEGAGANP